MGAFEMGLVNEHGDDGCWTTFLGRSIDFEMSGCERFLRLAMPLRAELLQFFPEPVNDLGVLCGDVFRFAGIVLQVV